MFSNSERGMYVKGFITLTAKLFTKKRTKSKIRSTGTGCVSTMNPVADDHKDKKGKRKEGESKNKRKLVILIGDRGLGVSSSIKGYRRYGGVWKFACSLFKCLHY
jgi:hypothetical protein